MGDQLGRIASWNRKRISRIMEFNAAAEGLSFDLRAHELRYYSRQRGQGATLYDFIRVTGTEVQGETAGRLSAGLDSKPFSLTTDTLSDQRRRQPRQ